MRKVGCVLLVVLAIALSALGAWGIEQACWEREKKPVRETEWGNLLEYDLGELSRNNMEMQEGTHLHITGEDPWFMLPVYTEAELSRIRISLSAPVREAFRFQLFYSTDYSLSEANSVSMTVPEGAEEIAANLPGGEYVLLRFDIDGDIDLAGIEYGYEVEKEPEQTLNWIRMAVIFIALSGLFTAGWMLARKGKLKRGLICLAAGLLIGAAIEAGIWYASPNAQIYIQENIIFRLYPDMIGAMYGCEWDEDGYIVPTEGDSQIHFPSYNVELQSILITLAEPAKEDIPVQIVYVNDEMGYATHHSVNARIYKGTEQLAVTIPQLPYSLIRTDFDKPVKLASITASADPIAVSHKGFDIDWFRWLLIGLGAAALLSMTRIGREADANRLPEKTVRIMDIAYAMFAGAVMLHHLYVILYYPTIMTGVPWMNIPFLLFAAVSVIRGRMWKDIGFWCFAAYWVAVLLRVMIPHPEQLSAAEVPLMTGVYAIFGCYCAGRALRPNMRRGFLLALCGIVTAAITALCCFGIYVAWTDADLSTPGNSAIYLLQRRLFLIFHSSTSGNVVSACAVVALFGAFLTKKKWGKALYIIACLIMVLTNALTATRTGYLTLAAAFAMTVCILLYKPLSRKSIGKRSVILGIRNGLILLTVFFVLFLGLTYGQTYIVDGFNKVKLRGGIAISNALAEGGGTEKIKLVHRDFSGFKTIDNLFSGRINIWEAAMGSLKENSEARWLGWSVVSPMDHGTNQGLAEAGSITFEHTHNLFIQTMLESGIVGLALFLAGIVYFAVCAVKLIRRREAPMWQKMLCVPVFAVLIEELDECMAMFSRGYLTMMILYLFMGMAAACSADYRPSRFSARPRMRK